jgi:hypothetical protein
MARRSQGYIGFRGAIGQIYRGRAGRTPHAPSVHGASVNNANPFAIPFPGDAGGDGTTANLARVNSANFHSVWGGGA